MAASSKAFFRHIDWLRRQQIRGFRWTKAEALILLWAHLHADRKTARVWGGSKSIAVQTGLSRQSVVVGLRRLQEKGILVRIRVGKSYWKQSRYQLNDGSPSRNRSRPARVEPVPQPPSPPPHTEPPPPPADFDEDIEGLDGPIFGDPD